MAIDKQDVHDVNQSLGRCLLAAGFMITFYTNFKASHPDIPKFFVKTDMNKQYKLLKEGITFLLMSAGGSSFAQTEITKLSVKHDTEHLNVKPELYKYWIDSLMKTVKEFDPEFTPQLERKWRSCLQTGIQQMTSYYDASKNKKVS